MNTPVPHLMPDPFLLYEGPTIPLRHKLDPDAALTRPEALGTLLADGVQHVDALSMVEAMTFGDNDGPRPLTGAEVEAGDAYADTLEPGEAFRAAVVRFMASKAWTESTGLPLPADWRRRFRVWEGVRP